MDIEKIEVCPSCGMEIEEMNIEVLCNVTVIWEESEKQYISSIGLYNLGEVTDYMCPHCNSMNTFDDEDTE